MSHTFGTTYKKLSKTNLGERLPPSIAEKIAKVLYLLSIEENTIVKLQSGHEVYLNPFDTGVSHQLYRKGHTQPKVTKYICENVSAGETVVDVGAHIGYFTVLFASLVGDSGTVFSFEPNNQNFDVLTNNIDLNGYAHRVNECKKAVSNHTGETMLAVEKGNVGASHLVDRADSTGRHQIPVEVSTLDAELGTDDTVPPVDFVKIDVEGLEDLVILGMQSVIEAHRPEILLEFNPDVWESSPQEMLEEMNAGPYQMLALTDGEASMISEKRSEGHLKPKDVVLRPK